MSTIHGTRLLILNNHQQLKVLFLNCYIDIMKGKISVYGEQAQYSHY